MSAHSPGPWQWDTEGAHGADSPEWHEVGRLEDGNGATVLASTGCENAGVAVLHVDARLIAAAPELLHQLRRVMALAERIGNSMGGLNPGALEPARALIARIEG